MILRKPYAFFIKIFKPLHIFMSLLVVYLMYITNNILNFFNNYLYSNENVVGQQLVEELVPRVLIYIPIVIIIFSLIFFGIMFNKNKTVKLYVFNIFIFIAIIVITIYTSNFLKIMETNIISIKTVKLYHDLVLINMLMEGLIFIFLIIRGLGINFKKFNFDSDITKLNISDTDKEEFELSINFDFEAAKRNRKKKIRHLKYLYKENKIIVNISLVLIFIISLIIGILLFFNREKINAEGNFYNIENFNLIANQSYLLKDNYNGNIITEDNLVIVDVSLQSYFSNVSLFIDDFSLEVGETIFRAQPKYSNALIDLGSIYNSDILEKDYKSYLFVYEVPDKYLASDMFFVFNNKGTKLKIKLNPKKSFDNKVSVSKNINEELNFIDSLGNITFSVNSFDIKNQFLINYNYCAGDNCIVSKEYIKPSINENFDKIVLKLNVNFINNSKLDIKTFYDFFSSFGSIYYKKENIWFNQISNFEELKSKKINTNNDTYIAINRDILSAESIKLVFNIRNNKYEYILK